MTTPDETEDLRALLELLQKTEPWREVVGGESAQSTMAVQPGSQLADDDRDTDPYQISHRAVLSINIAVDFLHCLQNSLIGTLQQNEQHINLHPFAQLPLLRGAIENGATATPTPAGTRVAGDPVYSNEQHRRSMQGTGDRLPQYPGIRRASR